MVVEPLLAQEGWQKLRDGSQGDDAALKLNPKQIRVPSPH